MIESEPDLSKYSCNFVWPGSINDPLLIEGRSICNNMKLVAEGISTQYLYGGGYYIIPAQGVDIQIFIPSIEKFE